MTTAGPTRGPPPARRASSASVSSPTASSISRGATARSAVSPRVSSSLKPTAARRGSIKGPSHSPSPSDSQVDLSELLKQETEQKEQLLVQVQDKDQLIASLGADNGHLTSILNAAETRINDLYAEQSRSENELAQRIDISEKLRTQVRELEKEKRDLHRRYNEQAETFEAERQAFYDNEQHLKSRIQSLTQARRQPEPSISLASDISSIAESVTDVEEDNHLSQRPQTPKQDLSDPDEEPAEMTALRLELSTLSTSYSSLQSTLVLLQTQLVDLKRVNNELQEENESYMILLRERTLSGRFDVMKQVGGGSSDDEEDGESVDMGSLRSATKGGLERVEEEHPEGTLGTLEQELENSLEETDSLSSRRKRHGRNRGASQSLSAGDAPRGESLADLPVAGPGLDLAAELGRAENKDILDGKFDEQDQPKRSKNEADAKRGADGIEPSPSMNDVDALRNEVKALKDANKALSLYASKIIDRIISQEGFEHVLAADYEKETTPTAPTKKSKPPRPPALTTDRSQSDPEPGIQSAMPNMTFQRGSLPPPPVKTQRRSMSFDWRGFSLFSGEKKAEAPLRPLTLGANPVTGARKLDTQEDEEDRRERERMNATLKLMGIQPTALIPSVGPVPVQKSISSPGPSHTPSPSTATSGRRFSFFGRSTPAATDGNSDTLSVNSAPSLHGGRSPSLNGAAPAHLTREALEHAEAENSIAALDAHERSLSVELAKGQGSGFTEITRRAGRRGRRSAGGSGSRGSGSTVWSAGLADEGDD